MLKAQLSSFSPGKRDLPQIFVDGQFVGLWEQFEEANVRGNGGKIAALSRLSDSSNLGMRDFERIPQSRGIVAAASRLIRLYAR